MKQVFTDFSRSIRLLLTWPWEAGPVAYDSKQHRTLLKNKKETGHEHQALDPAL